MTGPFGEVIVGLGRYTRCVPAADYSNPGSFGVDLGPGGLGKDACDYLLGRKLVCLGGVRCAIGTIIHIEPVGYQKPFPDDIDNDFCVNLLLFPHSLGEFGDDTIVNWHRVTNDGIQGELILHDPAVMPEAKEPAPGAPPEPTPYTVTYLFGDGPPHPYEPAEDKTERLLEEVKQDAAGIRRRPIPVLHGEFEGSRIFFVCKAIEPFLDAITGGPGAGACRNTIGKIPLIGGIICTIIETIVAIALAPFMAAAAAAAWAAAGAFDEAFITGPVSRRVALGDDVIVTGRWVWDGGHSGWNELHAVHTLQKIVLPTSATAGFPKDEANDFVDRWCRLVAAAPPPVGSMSSGLTVEQEENRDRQRRPEHGWLFHPAVDGCRSDDEPPDDPVIR